MSEETAEYQVRTKNEIMNDNARNTFAAYGLEILKRAVLLVLYEEHKYGERRRLLRKEIGERLGIENNDRLIEGILWELYEDEYVDNWGNQRWYITPRGISVIEG